MARVAGPENGGLLKIALAANAAFFAIIVGMLAYWISNQADVIRDTRAIQNANGNRLTAIEIRLLSIEREVSRD